MKCWYQNLAKVEILALENCQKLWVHLSRNFNKKSLGNIGSLKFLFLSIDIFTTRISMVKIVTFTIFEYVFQIIIFFLSFFKTTVHLLHCLWQSNCSHCCSCICSPPRPNLPKNSTHNPVIAIVCGLIPFDFMTYSWIKNVFLPSPGLCHKKE